MNATTQTYALAVLRVFLIAARRRHQVTVHINEIRNEVFKHLRIVKEKKRKQAQNYIHAALQALETNKVINGIDDDLDPTGQIRRADRRHLFCMTRKAMSWFIHNYPDLASSLTDEALMAAFYHFNLLPTQAAVAAAEEDALDDVRERAEETETAPWETVQPAKELPVPATVSVLPAPAPVTHGENMATEAELVETIKTCDWTSPYTPALLLGALRVLGAVSAETSVTSKQINWDAHKVSDAADVLADYGLITWAYTSQRHSRKRKFKKPARSRPYLTPLGQRVAELGEFTAPVQPRETPVRESPMLKNGKKQAAPSTTDMVEVTLPNGQKAHLPQAILDVLSTMVPQPVSEPEQPVAAAPVKPPRRPKLSREQTIGFLTPDVVTLLCRKIAELQTAKISDTRSAEEINKRGLYHALNVLLSVIRGMRNHLRAHLANDVRQGETPFDPSLLGEYAEWFVLSMEELAAKRSRDIPVMALDDESRKLPVYRLQGEEALHDVKWSPSTTPTT